MSYCCLSISPSALRSNINSILRFIRKHDKNMLRDEVEWYLATCKEIDQILTDIKPLHEETSQKQLCTFCGITKGISFYLDHLVYDADNHVSWRYLVFRECIIKHRAARKLYQMLRDTRVYHLMDFSDDLKHLRYSLKKSS